MTEQKKKKKIEEKIEELGWFIHKDKDEWELEQWTPAGEDFIVYINGKSSETIFESIRDSYEDFDVDEHVREVMNIKGAPCISALVNDAKDIDNMLENLLIEVNAIWKEK